jgi:hypothetical protein
VIFCVDFTEPMRILRAFKLAIHSSRFVIPAKAGTQNQNQKSLCSGLGPGLRRDDGGV